ncbi:hypothetical protein ACHZ98_29255 [Streptomyces sp. MAR4 CNY-716]
MPRPTLYAERLADEITHQLGQLADRLSQLSPGQAARVIARLLDPDPEEGVLGGITHFMVVSSVLAKDQAARGALPPEVWLALGRASNELDDIALDLDEHRETLHHAREQLAAADAKPAFAAPTARRHR